MIVLYYIHIVHENILSLKKGKKLMVLFNKLYKKVIRMTVQYSTVQYSNHAVNFSHCNNPYKKSCYNILIFFSILFNNYILNIFKKTQLFYTFKNLLQYSAILCCCFFQRLSGIYLLNACHRNIILKEEFII